MKYSEKEYIGTDVFDGADRDVEVKCRSVKIVTARRAHPCAFSLIPGRRRHDVVPGVKARYEHALVDGVWGSYYICLRCLDEHLEEQGVKATGVTLEDDSFADPAVAALSYSLWSNRDGSPTSAVQILARPTDIRGDESGRHPDEDFVMITLTREEVEAILADLNEDWATQEHYAPVGREE